MRAVAIRYESASSMCARFASSSLRTGQMRRIAQSRYGVRRRVDELLAGRIREQVEREPDWTLDQLRDWIWRDARVSLSRSLVWLTLERLGLV